MSHWLIDESALQTFGLLGDKVFKVISAGDAPTFAEVVIGEEQWIHRRSRWRVRWFVDRRDQ